VANGSGLFDDMHCENFNAATCAAIVYDANACGAQKNAIHFDFLLLTFNSPPHSLIEPSNKLQFVSG
jgi:hypothetical protein